MKPVVLVTRRLPAAVEDRLLRDYRPRLNPDDRLYDSDSLIESAVGADAIVACHTERFTARVIDRLPQSVRILANFSVGFDHVDIDAAKRRGLVVTNTPEDYAFLAWPMTADRFPYCGPLAGIHAALAVISQPAAFVCACDTPLVEPALVRFLCAQLADNEVVLPWLANGPEPLYAVYSRAALPAIEAAL
ncbi:MAG: hypothetical protein CVU64_08745, partial [Deltaproteobacteria bacterium HGW-Deltaproteobacteria-21]